MDEEDDDVDNTNMSDSDDDDVVLREVIHKAELDFVKRQPQGCASLHRSFRSETVSIKN